MSQSTVTENEGENSITSTNEQTSEVTATTIEEEAPKPVKAKPEPKAPEPGEACDIKAKGRFDHGQASMVVDKKCHLELDRTQIMILETDEYKVVFHRTDVISKPPKEDNPS